MDSCYKESITFFNQSRVVKTLDQDETDFTKSLRVLEPFIEELKIENVIVLCETSGRMDQILANINSKLTAALCSSHTNSILHSFPALFKNQMKPQQVSRPVLILSANSLSWLLAAGRHQINIPESVKKLWCSLVPFEPTTVTTSGLKWNLKDHTMKFGGIVSTSNKYDALSDTVEVTTDRPLLWSMGISKIDDD